MSNKVKCRQHYALIENAMSSLTGKSSKEVIPDASSIHGPILLWWDRCKRVLMSNKAVPAKDHAKVKARLSAFDYVVYESCHKVQDPMEVLYIHDHENWEGLEDDSMVLATPRKTIERGDRYGFLGPTREEFARVFDQPYWRRYEFSDVLEEPDYEHIAFIASMDLVEKGTWFQCSICKSSCSVSNIESICGVYTNYTQRHEEEIAVAMYLAHSDNCKVPLRKGVVPTEVMVEAVKAVMSKVAPKVERLANFKEIKHEFECGTCSTHLNTLFKVDEFGNCVRKEPRHKPVGGPQKEPNQAGGQESPRVLEIPSVARMRITDLPGVPSGHVEQVVYVQPKPEPEDDDERLNSVFMKDDRFIW